MGFISMKRVPVQGPVPVPVPLPVPVAAPVPVPVTISFVRNWGSVYNCHSKLSWRMKQPEWLECMKQISFVFFMNTEYDTICKNGAGRAMLFVIV